MNFTKQFLVKPGSKVKLKAADAAYTGDITKKDAESIMDGNAGKLLKQQELLYAEHKRSLLICLQAMDTGGKDGVIRHVLSAMNPQGFSIVPFKQPTPAERDHDFLWRAHRDAPGKGEVTVFNRSHYEDVLVVRVHDLVPKPVWQARYDQINTFERLLADNNTHIIKFFLHISEEEQLARLKSRIDTPSKQWKLSKNDFVEREHWDSYMEAFEEALSKCSTDYAPWFIIPSNNKWFRNAAISQILVDYLEGLKMDYPKPSVDMDEIRRQYSKAAKSTG